MNVVLVRLGLPPVAVGIPKQEYLDALNDYIVDKKVEPLLDLLLENMIRFIPSETPGSSGT